MAIGSHHLSQQGAITKRMTAIEEMAWMDVLCSDKTGTLTLNKLTVDKNLIEIFARGVDTYCCSDGSSSIPSGKSRCNRHCYIQIDHSRSNTYYIQIDLPIFSYIYPSFKKMLLRLRC